MANKRSTYRVRLGLLIQPTHDRDSYLGDYFHVRAYPVTIGPTVWEQQYRAQRIEAGKSDDSYTTIADDTVRHAGDDRQNGLRLDCLQVTSQGRAADEPRHLYAWDVEYRDVYSVDLRRAEQLAKTLRAIATKTDKLEQQYGRPATFGQYVARVANAIGAEAIVFADGKDDRIQHTNGYRICTLGDGVTRIDSIVRGWIDAGLPQPTEQRAS